MKKVALMIANGSEEIEALTVVDVMRRAGITCDIISVNEKEIISSHNIKIVADKVIDESIKDYDMIVLPGGLPGADNLAGNELLIKTLQDFSKDNNKYIGAICASPAIVLSKAGIEKGKNVTSYPGKEFEDMLKDANYTENLVEVDGNLVTSRGPATAMLFAYKLVEILGYNSKNISDGMLWNLVEGK